jgi:hypothetical protein
VLAAPITVAGACPPVAPLADGRQVKDLRARFRPRPRRPFPPAAGPRGLGAADDTDWADIGALAGPGGGVALTGRTVEPPDGWEVATRGGVLRLIDDRIVAAPDAEAARLTEADRTARDPGTSSVPGSCE